MLLNHDDNEQCDLTKVNDQNRHSQRFRYAQMDGSETGGFLENLQNEVKATDLL